jgi:FAD:protein FMN transferase
MGTDVHVVVVGGRPGLVEDAAPFLEDLEARWSRFRPTSEISMLNAVAGLPVRVSAVTLSLIELALQGARMTDGMFDPTVLGAVLRAGYDRTFERMTDDATLHDSRLSRGYAGIVVDPYLGTVALPRGVGFDPGGIGKGYAADLIVDAFMDRGAAGACINVGGDLRAEGTPPAGGPWAVAAEHPSREEPAALIGLRGGAVATSTRTRRAWGPADDRRHHVIDPATDRPASTGLMSVTVIAARAWLAEVLAKAAFLSGPSHGLAVLESAGVDGLLVDDSGHVHQSAGLAAFTGPSASNEDATDAPQATVHRGRRSG